MCRLCFVLINKRVLWNLLCVWILFSNTSSHSCFRFLKCQVPDHNACIHAMLLNNPTDTTASDVLYQLTSCSTQIKGPVNAVKLFQNLHLTALDLFPTYSFYALQILLTLTLFMLYKSSLLLLFLCFTNIRFFHHYT